MATEQWCVYLLERRVFFLATFQFICVFDSVADAHFNIKFLRDREEKKKKHTHSFEKSDEF